MRDWPGSVTSLGALVSHVTWRGWIGRKWERYIRVSLSMCTLRPHTHTHTHTHEQWLIYSRGKRVPQNCDGFAAVRVWSIASTMSVCLSVCHSHLINQATEFHQYFVHVVCRRGSVLLWRRCDRLCTSGFVDYVMFYTTDPMVRASCLWLSYYLLFYVKNFIFEHTTDNFFRWLAPLPLGRPVVSTPPKWRC